MDKEKLFLKYFREIVLKGFSALFFYVFRKRHSEGKVYFRRGFLRIIFLDRQGGNRYTDMVNKKIRNRNGADSGLLLIFEVKN